MTKLSTSFNKQLLDYWGFIKEMYYWRGSLWLFSSNGYREQRKFMRIETENNKTFLSCVSFRKFRNVQTQSDILKCLLLLTNVECWNCLAMVNVIIFLFPLFVFLKQLIAWLKLNPAICYLASLKAYTSKISSRKIFFFKPKKWLKAYETGYPVCINNFLKPERVVCSKCQYCSSIKTTSLKLIKSGQFFFHANYRIPVCETTTKYFWYNWLPVHVNMSWALG